MNEERREPGPLEGKVKGMMSRAVLDNPLALEALTGEIDDASLAARAGDLPPEEIIGMALRLITAQKRAILLMAQEIDAINAPTDGGQ